MIPRIVDARHVRDFVLHLRLADGTEGEVDLRAELDGEVFRPLRDPDYFRQASVHPERQTVVWPNGADFAPEFLYEKVQVAT